MLQTVQKLEHMEKKLLELNLGLHRDFSHIFIITNVTKPIIGADFLVKFDLLPDLKNQKLLDRVTNIYL